MNYDSVREFQLNDEPAGDRREELPPFFDNTIQKVERLLETITESIYDFPKYYDLVFGTDCAAERKFIQGVDKRFLDGKAKHLFEPACGTGRLVDSLVKKGYQVDGIDLNEKAIDFCNKRLERNGFEESTWVADMTDFSARKNFDLAFNTINSFRHLTEPEAAVQHLSCMAQYANSNAVYLVGIHLTPVDGVQCDTESWSARLGNLSILTHMWTEDRDEGSRMDRFGIRFEIYTPTNILKIVDELKMLAYTSDQFENMIEDEGSWTIEETYDFAYNIKVPVVIDEATEDIVYVLRKR